MPKITRICKTCGKEYECCRTPNPNGIFRWFDVACSRECAQEYFKQVMIARGEYVEENNNEKTAEKVEPASANDSANADENSVSGKTATKQRKKSK